MISAPLPDNEQERIDKLKELDILDTLEEQAYDDLTLLAAQICNTPIALVSLIDSDRQWFKSHHGLAARETPREFAFCAHAILGDDVLVVEDADKDQRFHDNPLSVNDPHVKFYAGAPLILENNLHLGTLCVIDSVARTLTDEQKSALEALARQVVSQLQLRLKIKELKHIDHVKDEFLAMVSHELRTPLTSITGSLSLLMHKKNEMPETMETMVDIAHRNSFRLLGIVNDILDLAKLEAGKLKLDNKNLDLAALLQQAIELYENYCKQCECHILFENRGDSEPISVQADEQRLLQVLGNLISNAAKFTTRGDTIKITLEKQQHMACIKVTDHGPGLTQQQQKDLFEKFKQLHSNSNEKLPGTGLGLNICKNIIELHHGSISCESVPGQYTSFSITLPLDNTENKGNDDASSSLSPAS